MYDDITTLVLPPMETAFFFDFDGTLAAIVDDPGAVTIEGGVLQALARLHAASGGALAVVSGREIETLDGFLTPLRLPLGGAHGSERRDSKGDIHRVEVANAVVERLAWDLDRWAETEDGLLVERKRASVALHYRQRPDLQAACRRKARDLAATGEGVSLLDGKMVVELKVSGRTKGDLIADFMAENPFRGRRPIFFGDDVTDEDAFGALPRWNGLSVKIGDGPTSASYRIPDPAALHDWLLRLTARMDSRDPAALGGTEPVASS